MKKFNIVLALIIFLLTGITFAQEAFEGKVISEIVKKTLGIPVASNTGIKLQCPYFLRIPYLVNGNMLMILPKMKITTRAVQ